MLNDDKPQAMVNDIIRLAARIWGVPVARITGEGKDKVISRIRQAVYLVAREHGHSTVWIGKHCGNRDHTSVIHGVRVADVHVGLFPEYAEKVAELRWQAADAQAYLSGKNTQLAMTLAFPVEKKAKPKKKPKNIFDASGGDFTQDYIANRNMILGNKRFVDALLRERQAA